MTTSQTSEVIQHLCRAELLRDGAGLTDGQLPDRFLKQRDKAAFAALVKRHGPLVWGARRLLSHHDAQDAFQAAVFVLFRKASIRSTEMVANTRSLTSMASFGRL
jgi:RNA polymerase sigma-70 factor (ECF subfamily)